MIGLTPKQIALLDYIRLYVERNGMSPTWREMTEHFGYEENSSIRDRLRSLEARGLISRTKGRHRSIRLPSPEPITLSPEIHRLATTYAAQHGIALDTAVNELVRGSLGAA